MQIHELRPNHKQKDKKRRGRGGKRGTYSGKGIKGQKSRSGKNLPPIIRDLIKRYPKLRGYRAQMADNRIAVINLGELNKNFEDSQTVNSKALVEKRLVSRVRGRNPVVKILSRGDLKKKLIFEGCAFSKAAEEKIKKAGGEIKNVVSKDSSAI